METLPELKIDEEFRSLIPPLSDAEYRDLENSILTEGLREPIIVWYTTIIDGHNRYEICRKHGISCPVRKMYFKNREEVVVWICTNQLARRNISDTVRRYLIGKRYETEKILGAHNAAGTNQYKVKVEKVLRSQNETRPEYETVVSRTRERLGKEYHLNPASIARYGTYTNAMDRLQEVIPDVAERILTGTLKVSTSSVIDLSLRSDAEIREFQSRIPADRNADLTYSEIRELIPVRAEKRQPKLPEDMGAIKKMPAYDPDAEVRSLSLTIPSWSRSIRRVFDQKKTGEASDAAREALAKELDALLHAVIRLLDMLKEGHEDE